MKEIRENPTEKVKISLFVDDILHIKDPKDSIRKFLILTNIFRKNNIYESRCLFNICNNNIEKSKQRVSHLHFSQKITCNKSDQEIERFSVKISKEWIKNKRRN